MLVKNIGLTPASANTSPLYYTLLAAGFSVCLLDTVEKTDKIDCLVLHLDYALPDGLGKIKTCPGIPVLVATQDQTSLEKIVEAGAVGLLLPHWSAEEVKLMIEFYFFKASQYIIPFTQYQDCLKYRMANILIVEDDELIMDLAAEVLTTVGQVYKAYNLASAAQYLTERRFDLLIIDVVLPDGDGVEFLGEFRKKYGFTAVPVLVFTVKDDLNYKLQAFEYGANDYLVKPFTVAEFLARVKALLGTSLFHKQLQTSLKQMSTLAQLDGLTGLFNHRYFVENLANKYQIGKIDKKVLAILMLDVDDFKKYNDRNGHPAGDEVLKGIAKTLRATVREEDIPARYGGEEFAVLLWDVNKEQALQVAERIRKTISEHPFPYRELQPGGKVTVSIGVAISPAESAQKLLEQADGALYRAKRTGKNKVEM